MHWPDGSYDAPDLDTAVRDGSTHLTQDAMALIADPRVEVVVECTGHPEAGLRHARAAIALFVSVMIAVAATSAYTNLVHPRPQQAAPGQSAPATDARAPSKS